MPGNFTYFAVRWGDNIRWAGKQKDKRSACKYCYGMVTPDMEVFSLGTRKQEALKLHKKLYVKLGLSAR